MSLPHIPSVHSIKDCRKLKNVAVVLIPHRPHRCSVVKMSDIIKLVGRQDKRFATIVQYDDTTHTVDDVLYQTAIYNKHQVIFDVDVEDVYE